MYHERVRNVVLWDRQCTVSRMYADYNHQRLSKLDRAVRKRACGREQPLRSDKLDTGITRGEKMIGELSAAVFPPGELWPSQILLG